MAYFDKYGVEFSDDRKTLVRCPKNFEGDYAIPYGITRIGDEAFCDCYSLISIKIPNSVTSIGTHAFWRCSGLTSIIIPNSVTSIGDGAFTSCSGLTSVTIGNSVTSIGKEAFKFCSGLTSVEIPDSVTSIGDYVFYDCSGLTSVTIPNSVTNIGDLAFCRCSSLTSIKIPDSVRGIGISAFEDCKLLTLPVYNAHVFAYMPTGYHGGYTIPDGIESIAGDAFHGCRSLTYVIIPNSVIEIGDWAFKYCTDLTSIYIPNSVTSIGDSAFEGCGKLISPVYNAHVFAFIPKYYRAYKIPDGIKSIAGGAFAGCSGLTAVTIPNSVTSIGDYAFADCDNLREICVPKGQKERFVKMNALSEYKNIIVEDSQQGRIRTSQSIGTKRIRTWDECLKEWAENKLDSRIKNMFGIHLTIEEYNIFKKEKRNIEQIHGWCNSGKYIHEMERLCSHLPSSDNPSGVGNNIGLKTPRKGFYRVIDVLDDKECTLVCYYNYHDPDEFVEEEVEISSRPLYNKSTIGPKDHLLKVGDILHIKEDVQLVEAKYDGKVYTTYKIVWDYVYRR